MKEETLIHIPPVDTSLLSPANDFLEELRDFNHTWDTDLEIQPSSRWAQGTYDKLKELSIAVTFPKMHARKQISTIFQPNTWNVDRIGCQVRALDNRLKDFRRQGIRFFDDNDGVGKKSIETLINNLNDSIAYNSDIKVEITMEAWFGGKAPTYPVLDRDGNVEYHENPAQQAFLKDRDELNPEHWYINIAIPLKDVSLNMMDGDKLDYASKYGDLVVAQTINLKDAIMLSRIYNNGKGYQGRLDSVFRGYTYQLPKYQIFRHPFVCYRPGHKVADSAHEYGTGNTCFGSFEQNILPHLALGNVAHAIHSLRMWASHYPRHNVSPLNRYYKSVFGKPLEIKTEQWNINPELCKEQVADYPEQLSQDVFIEKMCKNCTLMEKCDVYKLWNNPEIGWHPTDDELKEFKAFIKDILAEDSIIRDAYVNPINPFTGKPAGPDIYFTYMKSVYLYLQGIVIDNYDKGLFFERLTINGWGKGNQDEKQFRDDCLALESATSFSLTDFIKWYRIAEDIYYHHVANSILGLTGETDIPLIRSTHIARQRVERVDTIYTFAKRL